MIRLNGDPSDVTPGTTIADLIATLGAPGRGIAVAVDAEVVPRSQWAEFVVADDTDVEVLTAVQGG